MAHALHSHVERAGRVQGRAQLAFVFTRLEADNVGEDKLDSN